MLPEDAGDGVVAARQRELVLEAFGAEASLAAEFDDLAFQAAEGLVGAVVWAPTLFLEGGRFAGLMATYPFADGITSAAELTSGGLEAVVLGEGDELLVEEMAVGAHAIKFIVGAVHGARMAKSSRHCSCSSGGAGAALLCVECSAL
jgi:hypothetical protein